MVGYHYLVNMHGVDPELLDDAEKLNSVLLAAANKAGATVMNHAVVKFQPKGVTAFVVVAESHLSIHTWPETGCAYADVFTCGPESMTKIATEWILSALRPQGFTLEMVVRD